MPTGYTAKLMEKGQTFPEFVMTCARAMGACIMMRDEPLDAPIPERFEPTNYHQKRILAAKAKLKRLNGMTRVQKERFGKSERSSMIKAIRAAGDLEANGNYRINEMAEAVSRWPIPSKDHAGLKDFMLEQLRISRTDDDYYSRELRALEDKSAIEFYYEAIAKAKRDIAYHTKEHAEEVRRTEDRNRWLQQLRDSLVA